MIAEKDKGLTFCRSRLRIARAFNGWTQRTVAERVEIGQQFVARLENGTKEPSPVLVKALGDVLGFESAFFYGAPLDEFRDTECAFRKRVSTQVSVRNRALACGTLFGQLVSALKKKVRLPQDRLIHITCNHDNEIEQAADRCRVEWGIALDLPIDNIVRLAEGIGAPVARFRGIGDKVDSFSRSGTPSVIVLTDKPASRCRYDVAHELGHL